MSDEYTPSTDEVRLEYMAVRWRKSDIVSFDARAEFDRWLTEVERTAAERAWEECLEETAKQGTIQEPENPYRAEVYRGEKNE